MFKDEQRDTSWNRIRQHDLHAFSKQLTPELFDEAARRANVRIGKSPLNLVNLVWLGIAAAMHHTFSFAFVLTTTLKLLEDQQNFYRTPIGKAKRKGRQAKKGKRSRKSKHCPYREDPTQLSEEAFAQARQRMPLGFWMAVFVLLAERFQQDHRQHLDFHGFRLLAIDGTALTLPNDQRLRAHYGVPKNGKRKKACPQARMVMITLPGVRIPIAYEVAPLCDSELTLAGRLMSHLRPNDLLLMDRGFLTYGMLWDIQQRGAFFGTRLRKQIKYKKRKCLGQGDWLVEWTPKDSGRRWKHLPRSIQLRVIHYKIRGFRPNAIVTNVLDPQRLSREDWVRVATDCDDHGKLVPGLYHRRWQIETTYFELKITLNLKSLRSLTSKSVEYELAGRVVYYLLVRWLMVLAAEKHGLDPLRISFSDAVRELDQMRFSLVTSSLTWVYGQLIPRLLDRMASHTVPLRPGRHYPRPNDTKAKDRGHGRKQPASKLNKRVNSNRKSKQRQLSREA